MSGLTTSHLSSNYEGARLCDLIPYNLSRSYEHTTRAVIRMIHNHLIAGNRIYVKFGKGARNGSIGYLDLDPNNYDSFSSAYSEATTPYHQFIIRNPVLVIKFDDSTSTVKIDLGNITTVQKNITVHGTVPDNKTVYVFTRKEKPTVKAVKLYDQFGIELKEGQTIITNYGTKNDFTTALATIERITDVGTIFIKTIPTPKYPKSIESRYGIYASNCMVVDESFMDRILLAKLSK